MRVVVAVAVVLCAGGALRAQDVAGRESKPTAMAADADPDWEVATVKPSDPNETGVHRVRFNGRHVMFAGDTVEELLSLGYGVQKSQLAGLPDWAKTDRWDIDGMPDVQGEPSVTHIQELMRKILAERFGMKLHHEQRMMAVFALTVAKGGAKLAAAGDPNGQPRDHGGAGNGQVSKRFTSTSMSDLILTLRFYTGRPVVDQTGLKGRYDFSLRWSQDEAQAAADPNAPPGVFTAIQEQLGLKLEAGKAPADVVVVDKVERPEAN